MPDDTANGETNVNTLSLFIFIDAFGWELASHYSFLDELLPVKAPLGTIFGYSSTCAPTILTGKMPRDHGHVAFFTRARGRSPFAYCRILRFIPRTITRRGRIRSYMSKRLQPLHGFTGYFQIYNMPFEHLHLFDYTEKRDIFEPGGINGGFPTIFDFLRENKIPSHRSDWHASESDNLDAALQVIDRGDIRFAYVYLCALDGILHNEGKRGAGVARKLEWYQQRLRPLIQRAQERYEKVRLFVFSDHGMTDTLSTCPLIDRIDAIGLRFGKDYLAAYDSTMARFWFNNPRARDLICAELEHEPRGHIVTSEELLRWGCDFPDHLYGELFFLMNPGILLCPSFMGEKPLAGMHGYSPEDKDSVAAFMTNVPGITMPRRLDDMYRLMQSEAQGSG